MPMPVSTRLSRRESWKVPPLHGGHCPHELDAKNSTYSDTLRTTLVPSEITIIAPVPRLDLRSRTDTKSKGTSKSFAVRSVFDGPPVKTALNVRPSSIPPPWSKISDCRVVPIGSSYRPGFNTSPESE